MRSVSAYISSLFCGASLVGFAVAVVALFAGYLAFNGLPFGAGRPATASVATPLHGHRVFASTSSTRRVRLAAALRTSTQPHSTTSQRRTAVPSAPGVRAAHRVVTAPAAPRPTPPARGSTPLAGGTPPTSSPTTPVQTASPPPARSAPAPTVAVSSPEGTVALPSGSSAPVQQVTDAVGGAVTTTGQTAGRVVTGTVQTVSGALPAPVSGVVSTVGQTAGQVVTGLNTALGNTVTSLGKALGG